MHYTTMMLLPHGYLSQSNNMQTSLFPTENIPAEESISGLNYLPNFITPQEEAVLIDIIRPLRKF